MSSDFLKCIICPKLPTFSDSSHLLTHVGSKGHLAHLHRLQVKSHQESEAAHKLSLYNQWFVENSIAQLLSERMLQKEAKKAKKRIADQQQTTSTEPEKKRKPRRNNVHKQQQTLANQGQEHSLPLLKISDSELADVDCTPIQPSRDSSYPTLSSSPLKPLSSPIVDNIEDLDYTVNDHNDTKYVSASPQLKGTRWPGMGLFDAATAELQRKRNQKKDASVIRRLEALSTIVDPHETISSSLGTVLKRRHMDNLENDSPVEGEVLVEPPTPKRQRTSRSKSVKTSKKSKERKRPGRPRRYATSPLASPDNLITSDTEDVVKKMSRFSPTEEEHREFKLAIRDVRSKKKKGNFLIFEDSSPNFGVDGSSERAPSAYVDANNTEGQLAYPSGPWARLQNDLPDPFKPVSARPSIQTTFEGLGHGKENVNPFHEHEQDHTVSQFANPLYLENSHEQTAIFNPLARHFRPDLTITSQFNPFEDDDSFMPVRNPLATGFGYMNQADYRGTFGRAASPVFAPYQRQPLFAP